MKKLLAVLGIMFAVGASATPREIIGTVDTPAVLTWVTDSTGVEVAPFVAFASSPLYSDASGRVWTIKGARTATPYATSSAEASGSDLGLLYATTNCTGTAYLNATTEIPKIVRTSAGDGQLYADGALAAVTINSRWVGYCITESIAGPVYTAVGPLTAPTLPAGPYHVEAR
jgi:hypothetical protein